MSEIEILSVIILFAAIVVLFLIRANNIIDIILLNSVFSGLTVIMYLVLDAPDVGMTEAVVGIITSVFAIFTMRILYKESYNFEESFNPILLLGLLVCAGIFIYAGFDLPQFGQADFNHYYLTNTGKDIGIPSTVTAILADYRGYDTLLETLVILIGGLSVYIISKTDTHPPKESSEQLIKVISKFILPMIILFAFYIQMHGEVSPGGGFQAGAILGASLIMYSMAFGNKFLLKRVNLEKLKNYAVIGIFMYFITGFVGILANIEFLNYSILLNDQILAQQLGIIIVELGVGITVSSVMLLIYFCLAGVNDLSNQHKL